MAFLCPDLIVDENEDLGYRKSDYINLMFGTGPKKITNSIPGDPKLTRTTNAISTHAGPSVESHIKQVIKEITAKAK